VGFTLARSGVVLVSKNTQFLIDAAIAIQTGIKEILVIACRRKQRYLPALLYGWNLARTQMVDWEKRLGSFAKVLGSLEYPADYADFPRRRVHRRK